MTDARSAGAGPGAPRDRVPPRDRADPRERHGGQHPAVAFFRANPQVFVLLLICLILGLGTFLAVLFGLVTASSDQTTGEPSGTILGVHTLISAGARPL